MAGVWRIAMLICVFFSATVSTAVYRGGANVNHKYDFVKFFNQSQENIWTYFSTWNDNFTCERGIIKNISDRTVVVETNYTINNNTYSCTREGKLYNVWTRDGPRNLLAIRNHLNDSLRKDLLYASTDNMCAVIEVGRYHGWPPVTFDLLVKESQLDGGPSAECVNEYNAAVGTRTIGQENRTVYYAECRNH
uniref:Lipocalin n=1 Tax=Rhipicephalus appendiculatus TaxID=34631 RepID=A0A131YUF8_RHIAP